jgi:hypothetical protein
MDAMLMLARQGIAELCEMQNTALQSW